MISTYEKYIKDGKVAVLYSPGFGAGWGTWNKDIGEAIVFDKEIVQAVLDGNRTLAAEITMRKHPGVYTGGAGDLQVEWLDEGTEFQIDEYDGSEYIILASEQKYLRA